MEKQSLFSPADLLEPTQAALASGDELMRWWLEHRTGTGFRVASLVDPHDSLVEMSGLFSSTEKEGRSVMACLQRARLRAPADSRVLGRFEDIPEVFASLCHWNGPGGRRGGFTYTPLLQKRLGDETPQSALAGVPTDFSLKGLEWLVARVDIHDFVRAIPPLAPLAGVLSRFVREAAFVVVHRNYGAASLSSGGRSSCSFGYSFLPVAPEPSPFGFGPGHFGAAIKQFQFSQTADGALEVSLTFLVSPRSEKVLSLAGFDPVYSIVEFVDRVSRCRFDLKRRAHDRLDESMLRLHGNVHHRLLMDMEARWS